MKNSARQFPTSVEEIMANPNKYGAPTFEQFQKNKSFWRKMMGGFSQQRSFDSIDNGPEMLRRILRKVKLKINGMDLPNLEAAEIALKDHGYEISDFEMGRPGHLSRLKYDCQMDKAGEGKYEVTINFLP